MNAIKLYRLMRKLYEWHVPLLPKCIQALIFLLYNSKVTADTIIGQGTYFVCNGISTVLIPGTVIGENCVLGLRFSTVRQFPYKAEPLIGNNVWIGPNVIVAGPVIIEDDVIIVGSSYVTKSVPKGAIVSGSPAKIVGWRKDLKYDITTNPKYEEGTMPFLRETSSNRKSQKTTDRLNDIHVTVMHIITEHLNLQDGVLSGDERIDELPEWDSLANVSIISALENHYGISFKTERLIHMNSIENIVKEIQDCKQHAQQLNQNQQEQAQTYLASIDSNKLKHSPLLQSIIEKARIFPPKKAIVNNDTSITYAELILLAGKCATFLKAQGLRAGDTICLSGQKETEFVFVYLASHMLGLINVIVDAKSNKERLLYIEKETCPQICIGYTSENIKSIPYDKLNISNYEPLEVEELSRSKDDVVEILFTTGTTGNPKGVCLTAANIYGSATNINQYIGNEDNDVEILGLPICHSFGLGRVRCNLILGATLIFINGFTDLSKFFELIRQYHVTGFGVVPAAWAYITQMSGTAIAQFANQIKYIEIGSAAMPLPTKKEMLSLFPTSRICMHYGSTEASRCCFMEFHDIAHLESIGKPVTDLVDVKIFRANGEEADIDEKGEICVKGNMVLANYLHENNTADAFYANRYFRTGDFGYKASDGYLYLLGREKELINVGGKKVSPAEVEEIICSLGVGDCVCVPMPDERGLLGEVVKCYILKDSTQLTFEEIQNSLKNRLEPYKCPAKYDWIEKIPTTSSGKKQRIGIK